MNYIHDIVIRPTRQRGWVDSTYICDIVIRPTRQRGWVDQRHIFKEFGHCTFCI